MNDEVDKNLKEFTSLVNEQVRRTRKAVDLLVEINQTITDYRLSRHLCLSDPDDINIEVTFTKEMTQPHETTYVYANCILIRVKVSKRVYGKFPIESQFMLKADDFNVNKIKRIIEEDSAKLRDIERTLSIIKGENYSV